ncbi:MAG: hypothetical protein KA343_12545 [Nitrosomonas sp.]|nr:hypothetical protein [Nitrosomonas sp.]
MQSKELAALIGISHQLCNRYKAKGMPTDSFEAAKAWYRQTLIHSAPRQGASVAAIQAKNISRRRLKKINLIVHLLAGH